MDLLLCVSNRGMKRRPGRELKCHGIRDGNRRHNSATFRSFWLNFPFSVVKLGKTCPSKDLRRTFYLHLQVYKFSINEEHSKRMSPTAFLENIHGYSNKYQMKI